MFLLSLRRRSADDTASPCCRYESRCWYHLVDDGDLSQRGVVVLVIVVLMLLVAPLSQLVVVVGKFNVFAPFLGDKVSPRTGEDKNRTSKVGEKSGGNWASRESGNLGFVESSSAGQIMGSSSGSTIGLIVSLLAVLSCYKATAMPF